MEDKLLGHLLKANDAATQREVEQHLTNDPAAIHEMAVLRRALAPLEADREDIIPPSDLWIRTLGRVAEHMVATEGPVSRVDDSRTAELIRRSAAMADTAPTAATIRPAPPPSDVLPTPARRWNVVAVIGLSLALLALAAPAVVHVRARQQQLACENTMGLFYKAASGYSDTNQGNFPQVPDGMPAATAAVTLKDAGYLSPNDRFTCPSAPADATVSMALATYAYTLGFRDENGELRGLDRGPGDSQLAIFADAPSRRDAMALPINHRHGQNVLFADGHVRFCTTSTVGMNGDDIFTNQNGQVGAGINRTDTSLGRPNEKP
ncbi:MAG TPA: hypothetical protein VHR66_27815 [Gemmataceae bacterium]|nr:hypothetical protein [Gemmataceae bacterium]